MIVGVLVLHADGGCTGIVLKRSMNPAFAKI
jgi:hypothetical protein